MHLAREANSPSEGKPLQSTACHLKRSSGFTGSFMYDLNKHPGKKETSCRSLDVATNIQVKVGCVPAFSSLVSLCKHSKE